MDYSWSQHGESDGVEWGIELSFWGYIMCYEVVRLLLYGVVGSQSGWCERLSNKQLAVVLFQSGISGWSASLQSVYWTNSTRTSNDAKIIFLCRGGRTLSGAWKARLLDCEWLPGQAFSPSFKLFDTQIIWDLTLGIQYTVYVTLRNFYITRRWCWRHLIIFPSDNWQATPDYYRRAWTSYASVDVAVRQFELYSYFHESWVHKVMFLLFLVLLKTSGGEFYDIVY